jgi:hypothetical protein
MVTGYELPAGQPRNPKLVTCDPQLLSLSDRIGLGIAA